MEYVNYYDFLSIDSIILNSKKFHNIRLYYRLYIALGRYYNTCIMQFNRVEDWAKQQKKLGARNVSREDAIQVVQVFSDIHFLLIAMEKCYKLETELYKLLFGPSKSNTFHNSKEVSDVRIMRNTLEHMDENLNKEEKNEEYEIPEDYINNGWSWLEKQSVYISNGIFTIRDRELVFSKVMFNHIYDNMWIIIREIQNRVDQIIL